MFATQIIVIVNVHNAT